MTSITIEDTTGDLKMYRSNSTLSYRTYIPLTISVILYTCSVFSDHTVSICMLATVILCTGMLWELVKVPLYMRKHRNRPPFWAVLQSMNSAPLSRPHRERWCRHCHQESKAMLYGEDEDGLGYIQYECGSRLYYTITKVGGSRRAVEDKFTIGGVCVGVEEDSI